MSVFEDILSNTSEEDLTLNQGLALQYRNKPLMVPEALVQITREQDQITRVGLSFEVQHIDDLTILQACFQDTAEIMRAHFYNTYTRIFLHFQLKDPLREQLNTFTTAHADIALETLWEANTQVPGLLHLAAGYMLMKVKLDTI